MSPSASPPGTILIADDNRMNRLLLARGLEQQGHTIAYAEDGREALELLGQQRFDLMLLDVLMPELDGYEVLAELKDDPHLRDIPVIMTSALSAEGVEELVGAIDRHGELIAASGELERRRVARLRAEVEAIVIERAAERARRALREGTMKQELEGDLRDVDPYALAERILNGHVKEAAG